MVVKRGNGGEVGLDTKDGIESIGLTTCLCGDRVECSLGLSAGCLCSGVRTADVDEVIAHELGDDVAVLCRVALVGSYGRIYYYMYNEDEENTTHLYQ